MTEDFRVQRIQWNAANREVHQTIKASRGDNNGRILEVEIINYPDLTGHSLSLAWKARESSGLDSFTVVDRNDGLFEIRYTRGMLSADGDISASLVLVGPEGTIESLPFPIRIYKTMVSDDAIKNQNENILEGKPNTWEPTTFKQGWKEV